MVSSQTKISLGKILCTYVKTPSHFVVSKLVLLKLEKHQSKFTLKLHKYVNIPKRDKKISVIVSIRLIPKGQQEFFVCLFTVFLPRKP